MSETLEARVAVLEHIAKDTREALAEMRAENRQFRSEIRADILSIRTEVSATSRWHLGLMLGGFAGLLGAMAKGFHWL